MRTPLQRYLNRSVDLSRWPLQGEVHGRYEAAVVIPALAESDQLPQTLASLRQNPAALRARTLIVVVVNQRADAAPAEQTDNRALLQRLPALAEGLQLGWIDATRPGAEIPAKQGVGLARRIGMDCALTHFITAEKAWIACLDADTRVEPSYLPALFQHFSRHRSAGAILPFRHRPAEDNALQTAIDRYEAYLHGTALGLAIAGSPYAYVSLGSALACTGQGYMAAGGMPQKLAGEDFYFLQQLRKTGGVAPVCGTQVHPSARLSMRTPFGTGMRLQQLIDAPDLPLHYPAQSFFLLEAWLEQVRQGITRDGAQLLQAADDLHPVLGQFLRDNRFTDRWHKIACNTPDHQRISAFHIWFDGLKTVRLLNRLADNGWARQPAGPALAPLYRRIGRQDRL